MHMTIAGAVHHGMKEMEVWMQTFAPNSGTPIHRHECEEVFITLKGHGTLYLSRSRELDAPGEPEEFQIYPNATFTIPVDSVHQATRLEPISFGRVDESGFVRKLRIAVRLDGMSTGARIALVLGTSEVRNTNQGEDLQVVVTISRPPMKSFIYKEWSTPHAEAVYEPREWDKEDKLSSASQQCKEPEAEDDVMADIAKLLGRSIEDIVVSDEIR
uniref:Uncharacterized protein n=2 Tax=Physcomitrium patens TaxID=3218 RepID=A0A7I4DH64_PHYPA